MSLNAIFKQSYKAIALVAGLFAVSFPALAETQTPMSNSNSSQLTYEPQLDNQRNPNEYCAKCHKFDNDADQQKGIFHAGKFHGIHLSKTNPSTGNPITCVSCHGNISEEHRRGAKDVMRFQTDIFSKEKPMYSVEQQNQVCFSCHKPEQLREKLWAHDVHAMKLPCAACHTLHPEKEAMKDLPKKQQVKLCVDCHGKQQALQAEKQAGSANPEQKDKK
ncbi:respiratory nitrite reductase-specific menaquinol--cytochrome-c reductase complex subunit NrfB precursor [Cricetibacter osteomyelitidis]|uniref:Respiratory nitrite reductase-specific menaquinol--cytochrome-c reductase complex subunit NrfB n=1 Tax=Cricetibacter osteomyelitidis TaxID=1521931 RepID=A0A4R2T2U6_9PAST|nr:cytochrome c nitrite reductase pentaheme subunit [Cricetibacter osteomyelitidis]TCP95536.1 respiratory nitrite reductase-specific menaquinol--cytochrome-c reductase complex subunit NrfB precursor [Cricetibacter osteomyelitidis]